MMETNLTSDTATTVYEHTFMREQRFKALIEIASARWRYAVSLGAGIFLLLFATPAYFENEFLYGRKNE